MIKLPTYYTSPHKIAGVDAKHPVLLALSGGADSVSLLYNLIDESRTVGFTVFAAHVNHNIRLDEYNNEAMRDEEFCRDLCDSLGVKLFVESVDVPSLAKESGESIEGAARRARYLFFAKVMQENDISILVTAHNATDNFETQLFNLCRGSSVAGTVGIPECRDFDGDKKIVRPILSATKGEILEFCSENSIPFVTDSTNFETDATRNKIRNIILPELQKIFPAAQRSARRLAVSAAETVDFMKNEADAYLKKEARADSGKIFFSPDSFNLLHIALRREIVSSLAKDFDISLEFTHIQSVITLIERAIPHSRIDLPKSLICRLEDGMVIFEIEREILASHLDYEIPFDGKFAMIPNTDFCVVAGSENLSLLDGKSYTPYSGAILKSNKIKDGLLSGRASVRSRREGDRIVDGGNTKKLKKLMCDKKIPLEIRNSIPLLCLDGEIVYAPMCAISDSAKMDGEEETRIFIYKK